VILLAVISMLALGLSISSNEISGLFKDPRLVVLSLAANFIVMPVVAVLIAGSLNFPDGIAPGLILIGCAAGTSVLPRLAEIGRADVSLAKGLAFILAFLSIFLIPLLFPYLSPDTSDNAGKLFLMLGVFMLIPLLSGFFLQRQRPVFAKRWASRLNKISVILLVVVIIAFWALYVRDIAISAESGELAIVALAILVFILIGLGAGYLLSGKERLSRRVTALGTAERNIAAAALISAFAIVNHAILLLVLLAGLISLILLHYLSKWIGSKEGTPVV
jgi:predicted Na+-dependent transporter